MEIPLPRPPDLLLHIHSLASESVTSAGASPQSEDKVVFPAPRDQSRQFHRARLLPEFPYKATRRGAGRPQGGLGRSTRDQSTPQHRIELHYKPHHRG